MEFDRDSKYPFFPRKQSTIICTGNHDKDFIEGDKIYVETYIDTVPSSEGK